MSKETKGPIKSKLIFNIILVGDTAVGKTCIISRIVGKPFRDSHITTMGMDKETIPEEFNGIQYSIKIWDTTGQERFASLATNYLKKADGVIFVYAINNKQSFENITKWLELLNKTNNNAALKMSLVANKNDLEDQREVTKEEGETLANKLLMVHSEVSAKTGAGLQEAYKGLVNSIIEVNKGKIEKERLTLNKPLKKTKKCC